MSLISLRLQEGDDYPFYVINGTPEGFIEREYSLCAQDEAGIVVRDEQGRPVLECLCGRVIRGDTRIGPDLFTPGGSFWTNSTTDLLASLQAEPTAPPLRGRCSVEGYESLALIPLHSDSQNSGLLYLADSRRDRFAPETIPFYESLAASIAMALQRSRAEAALRGAMDDLEARVQERTRDLEASNAELQAFAYTVSHDLRAPLRAVQGFAHILEEDYGNRLDGTGVGFIHRILTSAARMDDLIQDLLAYSRLTTAECELAPVSLKAVTRRAVEGLGDVIRERKTILTIQQEMPEVTANETVLLQIMFNLLANSVKFTLPEARPVVEIMAEDRGDAVRLWVVDNGIGIAPEHQDRVFGVFERLHAAEVYPGTGIGLAIVHKGISRMGGRCGVESTPGVGSRFWIELPKAGRSP